MKVPSFGQGDERLDDASQVFGLRQCRDDLLMLYERRGHVGEHCLTMTCRTVELTAGSTVTHCLALKVSGAALAAAVIYP
jgi:hypothetical protein